MRERRFLDDLTVGEVNTTREIVVTEADIIEFARSYDPQPMHTGIEAASCGAFGGLTASGSHTAALVMRLLVDSQPLGSTPLPGWVSTICAGQSKFDTAIPSRRKQKYTTLHQRHANK